MQKFFVKANQIENNIITIIDQDVNHIKNVLRMKKDEELEIGVPELQINYLCKIFELQSDSIKCEIIKELKKNTESNIKVSIFQGLPKSDKMEWIIQKSVELGVYEIIPTQMKRSVVKLTDKDKIKKVERWQKISEVAAKQCKRDYIPNVKEVASLKDIEKICNNYDILLVAYEEEKENSLKDELKKINKNSEEIKIAIVVGPEGGLEQEEVEFLKTLGVHIVTLGKRILRTETVCLQVLSNIMYELE